MLVNPEKILPSQNYLKPDTVKYILGCIRSGEKEKLPPAPIVRNDGAGRLIAIDGHNLIAVKVWLGEDIEVHVAVSPDDGLPPMSKANLARNNNLKEKFESVITENKRVQEAGILTFNDLLARYEDLFHTAG